MLRDLSILTNSGAGICGTNLVGVLASELPSGFDLPGLLNNDVDAGDPAGTLYRVQIIDWPSSGTLAVDENGAFSFTGAANGTYTGRTLTYKNGVPEDSSYEFVVGTSTAVFTGTAAGTSTASAVMSYQVFISGTATGTSSATASTHLSVFLSGRAAGSSTAMARLLDVGQHYTKFGAKFAIQRIPVNYKISQ